MARKIYLEDIEDMIFESEKQSFTIDKANIIDMHIQVNNNFFKGNVKEIILENFRISYGKMKIWEPTSLFFETDEETVEMHFTLQGSSITDIDNYSDLYLMKQNTHNIFYCDGAKGKMDWTSKHGEFFEINLKPDFFEQYLPDGSMFDAFKKIIQSKSMDILAKYNYPITPKMLTLIYEILNCQWKNQYRQLFLEAKVLELLLLQLDQIQQFELGITAENQKNSKTVIEKMYYAKTIILSRLNDPMCLSELARAINTNEYTLKKEFKNVFGTTVFGYIRDTQMEQAKNVLLNQKITVSQV
jgi:AraC-like DNA-binding protein